LVGAINEAWALLAAITALALLTLPLVVDVRNSSGR
jgi:hypothetical protein